MTTLLMEIIIHVVLTTHNSRFSKRMQDYNVKRNKPLLLTTEQEIKLSSILLEIVKTNQIVCFAFNICKDHIHILIQCDKQYLPAVMKLLKGKSSYLFHKEYEYSSGPLWSQKYF